MNNTAVPNAGRAQIDRRKLTDYLLSGTHPVGRGKARFFVRLGFGVDRPETLELALRGVIVNPENVEAQDTGFGKKYIVDGHLRGPGGAAPIRTVWIIDAGAETPRFVTAYPRREP